MKVKDWFLAKNLNSNQQFIVNVADDLWIMRETEKAALIMADSDYGKVQFWCPKSCIISDEDYQAQHEAEIERIKAGGERLAKLIEWAKEQGVKGVRKGMRKVTVLAKIEAAGLVAPQF